MDGVTEPAGLVLPSALVTKSAVFIDGVKLPGLIEQDGVVVRPGGGRGVNRVDVTFLVGAVDVEDAS